jgi:hypothetical protein
MAVDEYKPERLFTIEQANAMLPLVRAITTDLALLAKDVVERRHRLALLTSGRDLKPGDPYSDELATMEADLERDATRLQEYVAELRQLGVEPKDGRVVFLCWRLGESEVLHWHDLESGFAGRQPLTAGSVPGGYGQDDESYND